ncbi:hypothetical protein nbrc107696_06230 [Gordonia spumicola]|uniref:Tape measure protein N-terminal domain-containing protein n=1 Tax=Gordonia spumicola TaxID=589161 RepID=A0A7I9V4L6_9ACTN|nr:tape measure protein [Gordonia spumicola]GEE00177.1 hypothetical protein nbrc107696_06230 [Gordonia spumicola]
MPELAVGYVSLVAETSKMGPAIKRALGQADGDAAAAGKSMGSKMSSALGTALKGGVATAGAAALGGIGFALTKGFSRLNTIDQAQAKLRALGSSGEEVESIMKNALAAVKGTAFGLGDAAGLAGTMVAAGIKPGQQLESTLRLVADSAAIAGTDLNDMGMIWGKIAAKGKLDGETLDQLMERQIGILPELAKNYGVTTEEASKMVSDGKVSFEDFAKVMTEKVGGGAEEMGQTVQGAFENMKAAAGRIGATALEPIFKALPGGFSGITDAIDQLEPKVGAFVQTISSKAVTEFGPKIQASAMAAWKALQGSGVVNQTRDTFMQLISTGQQLAPTVIRIATSIASVSASLGVGTWQVAMAGISGVASVLSALEPVLSGIADLMEAQPALVGAALIGWMAFKTMPTLMSRVSTATSTVTQKLSGLVRASALSAESESALAAASTRLAQAQNVAATAAAKVLIAEENLARVRATAGATAGQVAAAEARVAEARLASTTAATRATAAQAGMTAAQAAAARQTQTFGSTVRQAYAQGAAGAQRFSRTAGVASAGMAGMRSAGAGLMGMMGGPWGVAMVGATVGVMALTSHIQKNKEQAAEAKQRADEYATAVTNVKVALRASRGEVDDNVFSALSEQIDMSVKSLDTVSELTTNMFSGAFKKPLAETGVGATSIKEAMDSMGLSMSQLTARISGTKQSWDQFVSSLKSLGVGTDTIAALQGYRIEFEKQQAIARMTTHGVAEFGEAIDVLGDKSATAESKLKAIKTAMDALNPARNKADAMRQMGESIRQAAEAAKEIGPAAFDAKGNLDEMGVTGGKLYSILDDLAQKQQQVASTGDGAAISRTNREIEATLQALADATNKPIEKIRELYGSFGGGDNIDLMVKLTGAPEAVQGLGAIRAAMIATPGRKEVAIGYDQIKAALPVLDRLGIKYREVIENGQKAIKVDVTGEAGAKLQTVIDAVTQIPPMKSISVTTQGAGAVRTLLDELGVKVNKDNKKDIEITAPLAPGVNALLEQIGLKVVNDNDKLILVREQGADTVENKLNQIARERSAVISVVTAVGALNPAAAAAAAAAQAANGGNADGSIRRYAAGGIRAAEAYANGGVRDTLPDRALIQQADPGGGLVQWAEPSTHGEAFIPLAPSKRRRSTDILAAVARMFGLELIPRDGSVSGLLGGIAGGAVSKLLKSAGADGITRFADGGFNGKQLRELVDGGHGASRPLTGAPYVWGGVNWGDCSGAVSAPARAAAGLPPFGGRMSTGSMGSDLPAMGYQRGAGKSGDMRVAYYNGGPGGGHAIGRLPDDVNVEMGGQNGGGMVGGPVGPDHPQFTDRWYLTVAQALDNAVGTLTLDSTTDAPSATTDSPTTTSTPDTVSKESTISGLVGDVVKTGVSGQIKDILDVFGVNDSPGALAAWAGLPVKDTTSGKPVDPKKLREAEDKVTDKETALKVAKQRLAEVEANKKSSQSSRMAAKAAAEKAEREAKQAKEDLEKLKASETTTATITPGKGVRDPGTHRPKRGEDTGVGKLSSVDAIKAAFKGGLREAWRSGDQWSATDWIVNKESTWKPDAQNGKYWGLIQAGEDVYRAAGVDPKTTDPALQAKAFDKYVDGRYKTPVDAKAFHEANNWYDQGGIAPRKGLMLKNINTPERVLSPRQTSAFEQMVRRDFQSGIGTDAIVAKLDQLIKVVVAQGPNGVQPARDDRDFADKQRQKNRRLVAAGKGGRV